MGRVPVLCNLLLPTAEAAREAPTGRIVLGFCRSCGLIYNVAFDPGAIVYDQAYENSLHFSPRFHEWAQALAATLVSRYGLEGKTAIDIGCGKGDFLQLLCEAGCARGIGFDASYEGGVDDSGADIRVIRDNYSERYADVAAELICCRHVLEHIPDPHAFLKQVRLAAGSRPAIYFEVPNVLYTLRDMGIWDIIYEHCSYFSPPAAHQAFVEAGFRPTDIYGNYGDQFLSIEAEVGSSPPERDPGELAELGRLVDRFASHFREKVDLWTSRVASLVADGRVPAIWGTGSKGVTFLNVAGGRSICCAVDINARKHGRYVPGTAQPVVPPERLPGLGVDTVLVMNPLYESEIRERLAGLGMDAEVLLV